MLEMLGHQILERERDETVRSVRSNRPVHIAAPRAFEELLSEHLDALYCLALRLCAGRPADAEDLLHDAMLRAFHAFDELRDVRAGRSWLYTILVRTNLNRVRGQRRRAEQVESDLDEGAFEAALAEWNRPDSPERELDRRELRSRITAALNALEADLRVVVVLSDIEGVRQRDVAAMLGVAEGTVASRLFRARRRLRTALAGDRTVTLIGGGR